MLQSNNFFRVALICALAAFATPSARADYTGSQRWFSSMSEKDRGLLQSRLMLLGHYQALADSTFGNYTYRAIQAFQTSLDEAATGVLTPRQKGVLDTEASSLYRDLGFDIVEDARGKMSMLLPQNLLPTVSETRRGTAY